MNNITPKDMAILIEDVSFTYPGGKGPSLKNSSLQVKKGEFIAITGNNGSGKSTLCKVINGIIPHFLSGDLEGTVKVDGVDTALYDMGMLSKKLGFVCQDFENQIICSTVLEDAGFACLNYAMPDYVERSRRALGRCDLAKKEKEYVWQLSGGEKHLLSLAGVMALDPEIYMLDEPAAQLDFGHAKEIYEILRELNTKHGKTIIVVEHHADFITEYCQQMVLMSEGEILWKCPVQEGLTKTEVLMKNNVFPTQITQAAQGLRQLGVLSSNKRLPITIQQGKEAFSGLSPKVNSLNTGNENEDEHEKTAATQPVPSVRFCDIRVEHRTIGKGKKRVFDGFSVDFLSGRRTALVGRNGSGKSTLLKLLTGMLRPKRGDILINGTSVIKTPMESLAQRVSYVFQNPEEMFIKDSIRNDIEFALKAYGMQDYRERSESLLNMFDLQEMGDKDGRLLSGGQMRRASIAIGIARKPSILLLDEPTANLDMASRDQVMGALKQLDETANTIVVATHDMQLVCEWADWIVVLSDGALLAQGEPKAVFAQPQVIEEACLCPPAIYKMAKALDPAVNCFSVAEFIELFGKGQLGV